MNWKAIPPNFYSWAVHLGGPYCKIGPLREPIDQNSPFYRGQVQPYNNMYLLTEREGRTGKYLALRTKRSEFRASWPRAKYFPVRPWRHSVNKHFIIWPLCRWPLIRLWTSSFVRRVDILSVLSAKVDDWSSSASDSSVHQEKFAVRMFAFITHIEENRIFQQQNCFCH